MPFSFLRQIERVTDNSVATTPREDGFLNCHIRFCATMESASNFGVLTLVVLAHDAQIDIPGWEVFDGGFDSAQQSHGTQVDILLKCTPDGDQQSPKRNMIGHSGI